MMKRYNYEPGNETRYDLLFGEVAPGAGYLLVWLHRGGSGGSAFRFDGDAFIAAGYLAEKMNIPDHLMGDAYALCDFLTEQGFEAADEVDDYEGSPSYWADITDATQAYMLNLDEDEDEDNVCDDPAGGCFFYCHCRGGA